MNKKFFECFFSKFMVKKFSIGNFGKLLVETFSQLTIYSRLTFINTIYCIKIITTKGKNLPKIYHKYTNTIYCV